MFQSTLLLSFIIIYSQQCQAGNHKFRVEADNWLKIECTYSYNGNDYNTGEFGGGMYKVTKTMNIPFDSVNVHLRCWLSVF